MAKVIAVYNKKGGCGKTTTATTLAYLLARRGKRTALIDLDSQGDSSLAYGVPNPDKLQTTILSLVKQVIIGEPLPSPSSYMYSYHGVDLVPSNEEISTLERNLSNVDFREYILKEYISQISPGYDYIIIDCILGKQKDDPDDDDKYAEYVTLKPGCGLTEHIMIYGATGSGKTRGFVKPFILQAMRRRESMVLVDVKGEIYEGMSQILRDDGYEVKMFNLLDKEHSDAWNCLSVIEQDKNLVQSIAEVIIKNTSNANERQDFWEKAELNLLMALMHYVATQTIPGTNQLLPIQQRSLGEIYRILSNESFADLEQRFEALPKGHPALPPYGIFKLANRQIWGNIAIGLGNRLSVFQNPLVDKITSYNEIDLTLPGQKPCAYFCCISAQDSSLEFLSSLFFSQLFSSLMEYGRRNGDHGRLPVRVNVCLEEFCNIGKLMDFKRVLEVCRGSNIFCQLVVQSIPQLKDRYPKTEWEELIGCTDVQICLGCNDVDTAKYISQKCGVTTIRVENNQMPIAPLFSPVYSTTRPYSQTKSNTQRPLMYLDEVLHMNNRECLVLLRGQNVLKLYKITPEEFPAFCRLKDVRVSSHKYADRLPLDANSMFVVDDEKQRSKMALAFYRTIQKDLAEYEKRATHLIQSGNQSPAIMDRMVLSIRELERKKIYYESILKQELHEVDEQYTSLRYLSDELQIRARSIQAQKRLAA